MNATVAAPPWLSSAQTLAAFVSENGALPRQSAAETPEERRAGNTLRMLRSRLYGTAQDKGPLSVEQVQWLDTHVPGWRGENVRAKALGRRTKVDHRTRTTQVRRFRAYHGRMPSTGGRSSHERQLARFLVNQRQGAAGRGTVAFDDTRRALLDSKIPGWDRRIVIGTLPLVAAV
jgi:hypothetical protein